MISLMTNLFPDDLTLEDLEPNQDIIDKDHSLQSQANMSNRNLMNKTFNKEEKQLNNRDQEFHKQMNKPSKIGCNMIIKNKWDKINNIIINRLNKMQIIWHMNKMIVINNSNNHK